ncbi:MAG: Rho-binding antiterminator [Pseudomonadota bacterium]
MITCELHDYIEIVCTYRYPIKIKTKTGASFKGIAIDSALDEN